MHANAHGISISDKKIKDFHDYANFELKDIDFGENVYDVNFERIASAEDLTDLIMAIGNSDALWGTRNPTPLINVMDICISKSDIQIMGKNKDTVKIEKNGIAYMKFKADEMIEQLENYESIRLNIVGTANINEWNGNYTPQIFIDDYEIIEDNGF